MGSSEGWCAWCEFGSGVEPVLIGFSATLNEATTIGRSRLPYVDGPNVRCLTVTPYTNGVPTRNVDVSRRYPYGKPIAGRERDSYAIKALRGKQRV